MRNTAAGVSQLLQSGTLQGQQAGARASGGSGKAPQQSNTPSAAAASAVVAQAAASASATAWNKGSAPGALRPALWYKQSHRNGVASSASTSSGPSTSSSKPPVYFNSHYTSGPDYCHVCGGGESTEENLIVMCDSCDVAVHTACYGIAAVPEGDWMCDACSAGFGPPSTPTCVFCPCVGGAMKVTTDPGKWAHLKCALWVPGASVSDPVGMGPVCSVDGNGNKGPIGAMPPERFKFKCSFCKTNRGAIAQCEAPGCHTAFHPMCCAVGGGYLEVEDPWHEGEVCFSVAYCKEHADGKRLTAQNAAERTKRRLHHRSVSIGSAFGVSRPPEEVEAEAAKALSADSLKRRHSDEQMQAMLQPGAKVMVLWPLPIPAVLEAKLDRFRAKLGKSDWLLATVQNTYVETGETRVRYNGLGVCEWLPIAAEGSAAWIRLKDDFVASARAAAAAVTSPSTATAAATPPSAEPPVDYRAARAAARSAKIREDEDAEVLALLTGDGGNKSAAQQRESERTDQSAVDHWQAGGGAKRRQGKRAMDGSSSRKDEDDDDDDDGDSDDWEEDDEDEGAGPSDSGRVDIGAALGAASEGSSGAGAGGGDGLFLSRAARAAAREQARILELIKRQQQQHPESAQDAPLSPEQPAMLTSPLASLLAAAVSPTPLALVSAPSPSLSASGAATSAAAPSASPLALPVSSILPPASVAAAPPGPFIEAVSSDPPWACFLCRELNRSARLTCAICTRPRQLQRQLEIDPSSLKWKKLAPKTKRARAAAVTSALRSQRYADEAPSYHSVPIPALFSVAASAYAPVARERSRAVKWQRERDAFLAPAVAEARAAIVAKQRREAFEQARKEQEEKERKRKEAAEAARAERRRLEAEAKAARAKAAAEAAAAAGETDNVEDRRDIYAGEDGYDHRPHKSKHSRLGAASKPLLPTPPGIIPRKSGAAAASAPFAKQAAMRPPADEDSDLDVYSSSDSSSVSSSSDDSSDDDSSSSSGSSASDSDTLSSSSSGSDGSSHHDKSKSKKKKNRKKKAKAKSKAKKGKNISKPQKKSANAAAKSKPARSAPATRYHSDDEDVAAAAPPAAAAAGGYDADETAGQDEPMTAVTLTEQLQAHVIRRGPLASRSAAGAASRTAALVATAKSAAISQPKRKPVAAAAAAAAVTAPSVKRPRDLAPLSSSSSSAAAASSTAAGASAVSGGLARIRSLVEQGLAADEMTASKVLLLNAMVSTYSRLKGKDKPSLAAAPLSRSDEDRVWRDRCDYLSSTIERSLHRVIVEKQLASAVEGKPPGTAPPASLVEYVTEMYAQRVLLVVAAIKDPRHAQLCVSAVEGGSDVAVVMRQLLAASSQLQKERAVLAAAAAAPVETQAPTLSAPRAAKRPRPPGYYAPASSAASVAAGSVDHDIAGREDGASQMTSGDDASSLMGGSTGNHDDVSSASGSGRGSMVKRRRLQRLGQKQPLSSMAAESPAEDSSLTSSPQSVRHAVRSVGNLPARSSRFAGSFSALMGVSSSSSSSEIMTAVPSGPRMDSKSGARALAKLDMEAVRQAAATFELRELDTAKTARLLEKAMAQTFVDPLLPPPEPSPESASEPALLLEHLDDDVSDYDADDGDDDLAALNSAKPPSALPAFDFEDRHSLASDDDDGGDGEGGVPRFPFPAAAPAPSASSSSSSSSSASASASAQFMPHLDLEAALAGLDAMPLPDLPLHLGNGGGGSGADDVMMQFGGLADFDDLVVPEDDLADIVAMVQRPGAPAAQA